VKTAESIEVPFGVMGRIGPRYGGLSPREGAHFCGKWGGAM